MRRVGNLCCTTPGSLCLCFGAFLVFYGLGALLAGIVPWLEPFATSLLIGAIGLACLVNAFWYRTYHCMLTGPLFLIAAVVLGLNEGGFWDVSESLLWGIITIGAGSALILEQLFGSSSVWRAPDNI